MLGINDGSKYRLEASFSDDDMDGIDVGGCRGVKPGAEDGSAAGLLDGD